MKSILLFGLLLCGGSIFAQEIRLQPQPQQITLTGETFKLPDGYNLQGDKEASPLAVAKLQQLLGEQSAWKGYRIYIGEKGDKSVCSFSKLIPARPEGYYLKIDKKQMVIAGNDERGTFYALQTLAQLLKEQQLPEIEIVDYPAIHFRGVVEGFYGTPWSHKARLDQLRFYGENKMNTYIYGPKNDSYHSTPHWRLPYPAKEAEQLTELVKVARDNEVDFVWAIHPGKDIKWNTTDRNLLISKFESMYQLGVRSFAVFFDDISGEGTNANRQVELLNYLDDNFIKVKPDVRPLVVCPTEYNKRRFNPKKGYLTTLGKKLNPTVHLMWTGDRVAININKEGLIWAKEHLQRPAYIWWNFPVSDYVYEHLLLGAVYGNDTDIANLMSGFVSNPMEHAEASKIAIYGVADYTWNPEKYNPQQAWEDAIRKLLPQGAAALQTFANHNSDLGIKDHPFSREESVVLQPAIERFSCNYAQGRCEREDLDALRNEFLRMTEAADLLLVNKENEPLIKEITPWIPTFKLLGESGCALVALIEGLNKEDQTLFMRSYRHFRALQQQAFDVEQSNLRQSKPSAKTGSKIVKPFIERTFTLTTQRYNEKFHAQLDTTSSYMPHRLVSNVDQFSHVPLQVRVSRIIVSPILEVVNWPADGMLAIELDKPYTGKKVEMDFGVKGVAAWGRLEVSTDGKEWKRVGFTQKENRITVELANTPLRMVRFTNVSGKEQEVYLKRFILTADQIK